MKKTFPIDTTVYCSSGTPGRVATYKIAAEWTGGGHSELKTYGFADDESLLDLYRAARERIRAFKPTEGETLGELQIYRFLRPGVPIPLTRAPDVEERVVRALSPSLADGISLGPRSIHSI